MKARILVGVEVIAIDLRRATRADERVLRDRPSDRVSENGVDGGAVTQALTRLDKLNEPETAGSPRLEAPTTNKPPELKPSEQWAVIASRGELQTPFRSAKGTNGTSLELWLSNPKMANSL